MVCAKCKRMKKLGKKTRCWRGYKPVRGKKAYSKGSCKKITRKRKLKGKIGSIRIRGRKINYKKGALRRQMGLQRSQKFSKSGLSRLSKIPTGKRFRVGKRNVRMTPLLKRRIVFGRVLMGMSKK